MAGALPLVRGFISEENKAMSGQNVWRGLCASMYMLWSHLQVGGTFPEEAEDSADSKAHPAL